MNIKKSFLVALAGATAVASMSAVAVSAATPGQSSDSVIDINVTEGQPATGTLSTENGTEITVSIPAGVVSGNIKFYAAVKADANAQKAIDDLGASASEILDMYFTDANGSVLDMTGKGIEVSFKGDYNKVYLFENTLQEQDAKVENGVLTFTAPHFSTYVLAKIADNTPSNPSTPDNPSTPATPSNPSTPADNNTTKTGDNGVATTAIVFSTMALVSLGTVVVATKLKKKAK